MKITRIFYCVMAAAAMSFLAACSDDDPQTITGEDQNTGDTEGVVDDVVGFYLLNEGNMGSNKCTLDYYDYATATYRRNIYSENNPDQVLELGDTGNDIAVYKGRVYIVVNGSHKVEVLDAATARRIGKVDINSPRYIVFEGDNAYVSSFVGGDGDKGSVVRFDINTLAVTGKVSAGLQPEELVIDGNYLYVANSGQLSPEYDNTISVIDYKNMKMTTSIAVDINMHHLRVDNYGHMWVTSRGNYADIPANLYRLDRGADGIFGTPVAADRVVSNMTIATDLIYYYGTEYDANWNATYTYGKLGPINNGSFAADGSFITDGTEKNIVAPYCIAVHPGNGYVLVTDAKNYTSSGVVYCYDAAGKLAWQANTGDIPGHIAFVQK